MFSFPRSPVQRHCEPRAMQLAPYRSRYVVTVNELQNPHRRRSVKTTPLELVLPFSKGKKAISSLLVTFFFIKTFFPVASYSQPITSQTATVNKKKV
jgi:predicted MFS family arabinose efflux permease